MEKIILKDPKSQNEVSVKIEMIDVQTAQKHLTRIPEHQRKIKPRLVAKYAQMMLAGQWQTFANFILFSDSKDNKRLIDGQHRLSAVIEASKDNPKIMIPMLVIIGAPAETIYAMDDGANRTLADAMEIQRHEAPNMNRQDFSYVIKQLCLLAAAAHSGNSLNAMRHRSGGSNVALLELSKNIPALDEKARMFTQLFHYTNVKKYVGPAFAVPFFYFFEQVNHDVTYEIFKSLEYGTSIDSKGEYSPILAYIKWIELNKNNRVRLNAQTHLWGFVKCFEDALSDKKVKSMRTDRDAIASFRFGVNHIGADKCKSIAKAIMSPAEAKDLKQSSK